MLGIAIDRLDRRIRALARFGALPGGGVTRPAFSPQHEEARAWLIEEMRGAGLTTWVDAAANVFGVLALRSQSQGTGQSPANAGGGAGGPGASPGSTRFSSELPAVLAGSHIDTVPEGGILDGALGVLGALECLQTIAESGTGHGRPLSVAAWTDEEGRFGSLFGSRAFSGLLDTARIPDMAAADGERLADAMSRAGFDALRAADARIDPAAVSAYVELHIEQGPRLEEAGIPIGVVEAIVGVRRAQVVFKGQADHAGTTPMERRRDGFLAAAEYALKARDHVVKRGGGRSVTNFGVVRVHPGVSNIVPARGELIHELRSPDAEVLERLDRECERIARRVAGRRGVEVEIRRMSASTPARCSPRVIATIDEVCARLGLGAMRMHSGAGHDAQNLAAITDAGMVFIPSEGGRSHRIDESSSLDAIERGANVLLHTLLALAG